MSNAIQPFDPAAAVNAIRDKIRGQMLDVIPTEQWDSLIKAEMKSFMTDVPMKNSWGETKVVTSGFKSIVREILEEDARKHVKAFLDSPEWQHNWDTKKGERVAGEAVKAYITEKGPEILRRLMNEIIANAIQSILSETGRRL